MAKKALEAERKTLQTRTQELQSPRQNGVGRNGADPFRGRMALPLLIVLLWRVMPQWSRPLSGPDGRRSGDLWRPRLRAAMEPTPFGAGWHPALL